MVFQNHNDLSEPCHSNMAGCFKITMFSEPYYYKITIFITIMYSIVIVHLVRKKMGDTCVSYKYDSTLKNPKISMK